MNTFVKFSIATVALALLASCAGPESNTTGWAINNKKNGGFQANLNYKGQETGPGLVFIEGGTFTMGQVEEDFIKDWNNIPRQMTVSSFYMDENEVTNLDYREYLYWLERVYKEEYPRVFETALPDTLVWRDKLAYNDNYVENYLRHPAYNYYPVVGVSWLQAQRYCSWRTDRVNEAILIEKGILSINENPYGPDHFNTEVYLYREGEYSVQNKKGLKDLNPMGYGKDGRPARIEDGILLPKYRLPTEAEWEYAAYADGGRRIYNTVVDKNKYSWNGNETRNYNKQERGDILANFKRGRGDNMGTSGWLNDQADITIQVRFYPPNDFGLYDMAGNAAEWVLDVYRPLSSTDVTDFRGFRGNEFQTFDKNWDNSGGLVILDDVQYDTINGVGVPVRLPGQLPMRDVTADDVVSKDRTFPTRRNYSQSDYRDYLDGDVQSSTDYDAGGDFDNQTTLDFPEDSDSLGFPSDSASFAFEDSTEFDDLSMSSPIDFGTSPAMYDYQNTSLINNTTRVYKGGSWKDRAYWLSPGTRRFLEEDQSTDYIGFRCAMDRVGFQNLDDSRNKRPGKVKRHNFKRYKM
ncbi:MAG: gliding motility lipoprotein GldJ [Schleiferiaceae bacterium]|nr:gliding motility lipoprotein GldJ [Schleiferiaceae bacterium]